MRVIHTGDTHVGYRQYHSPERRQDFLDAFDQVVEDAIAEDVDALVHAGDLFHDRRPGLVDLQGVVGALRRLDAASIPFLAVVGNHEGKRDAQWLDLFEDLGLATRLGDEPHEIGEAAVYGLDFVPRSRREDLDYEFEPSDREHALLVSHGLFEPFAHADWDTHRLLEESTVAFDALLLGDNHKPGREDVDGTLVTYCGSTERASAEERDERGYNIVTVDDGVSVSRRGLDATREFVFVDLELENTEGESRVREAVRQHDLEDAVVIVTIEGEGDPVTPAVIEEFASERGALVARVNDRRELDDESETEVQFADPDRAVRERVADLGLSQAARGIDATVRDLAVARTNVREDVADRVSESLEEDPGAFEPVEEADTPPADGEQPDGSIAGDESTARDGSEDAVAEPDEREDTTATTDSDDGAGAADQASMEEYL